MAALSIADVKKYLRYRAADTSQDDPLAIIVNGGQRYIENYTGHLLVQREVTESPVAFPVAIQTGVLAYYDLRWKPYVVDSLAVAYLDTSKAPQEYEDFTIYPAQGTQRVIPASAWPGALAGVTFTYTAGYETDAVPEDLLHALCLYSGMSDEERGEASSAGWTAMEHLLIPYRLPVLA